MAEYSFDISSKINMHEIDNAKFQAEKTLNQRYDLKNCNCKIEFKKDEHKIILTAPDDYKIKAVYEILCQKLVSREISLKALNSKNKEIAASGIIKETIEIQQGINQEEGKKIMKKIKESNLKVQTSIQKDKIRVTSKKKDTLQTVIQLIKNQNYNFHLEFSNFR